MQINQTIVKFFTKWNLNAIIKRSKFKNRLGNPQGNQLSRYLAQTRRSCKLTKGPDFCIM